MNKILQQDIDAFVGSFDLGDQLKQSAFLITGATGLIGSTMVRCLCALEKDIKIVCPVRNIQKANVLFGSLSEKIQFVECDLLSYLGALSQERFDYIVHCASPTAGSYMTSHPVETYELAIESTRLLLSFARNSDIKGMVYISSLEYYGQVLEEETISEDFCGYVDPQDPRSSYPLGKRAAEFLCTAYAKEYGVNVKIARLTQTFGAGISPDDNRVFAQFARSIINGEDIVLHTTGESAKPYCYTTDCISAILYILCRGDKGEAYNVANSDTFISIRGLAEFLRDTFNSAIKVRIESHPEMGYAPVTKLNLSAEKLCSLGWCPQYGLKEMFSRLINSLKNGN